ncbi:hypothetical protein Y900_024170 [Mycolicibacterium aromaticivorans JS19b1 = JCM 16368]|uniref:Uncharacterized protein n=2 Tax=Mycolicibacterium aromaticivorans TaxID=318425 RepID=A0A064CTA6_9MYCO|nr:hypothetical protein Y900_024170 [Mycolicibacterium aromaticivorans JS19b1 = JCM 16368]
MGTVMTGWRYWFMLDEWLYSPHPSNRGRRSEVVLWPRRDFRPSCPIHPNHVPPVDDCSCGVYFATDLADILSMATLISGGVGGMQPRSGVRLVVGQLTFKPPIIFRRNVPLYVGRSDDAVAYKLEGRAAGATIEKLWISGGQESHNWESVRTKSTAKARYRVPVVLGLPNLAAASGGASR